MNEEKWTEPQRNVGTIKCTNILQREVPEEAETEEKNNIQRNNGWTHPKFTEK